MFGLSYMRYFCLFLILFLSACAPTPVKRTPANSISEAEAIANRDDLTPMEQRQLLLSTPYVIELLPSFEGVVFSNEQSDIGTDIKECVDFGLTYDVNHNQFVQEYIAQKELEAGGAEEVVASSAAAVGAGALAAGILAIAILGPIAGSLGAGTGTIVGLGTTAAAGVASSLAATIGPVVLLGAIAAESEKASIENMCAEAQNPDILLNNAGVLWAGPFDEMPSDEITKIVNVNLIAPMQIAHNIGKKMLKRGSGIIVNTSSQLAFHGAAGRAVYASTKAGIAQFTKSLAAEWMTKGVRVVAIAPGRTLTNINLGLLNSEEKRRAALKDIPAGRLAEAHEMARLALLLSSDVLSYVVGETIISDGGYVLL